jgi:hypothetical protein
MTIALKSEHEVITPREGLRDERPLDALEIAVHRGQAEHPAAHSLGTTKDRAEPGVAGATGQTTPPLAVRTTLETMPGFRWTREITPHEWMKSYARVPALFAVANGLRLTLTVGVPPEDGVSSATMEELKVCVARARHVGSHRHGRRRVKLRVHRTEAHAPIGTDEKRWIGDMLTCDQGLGFR